MSQLPWIEKYRPTKLDDIVSHKNIISLFKSVLETGNLPHLLMYGNPGSGKCLGADTKVLLYSGEIKCASDITKDDILMGDDNKPRYIISLASGVDDMYEINVSNGDSYIVNSHHILSLKDSCGNVHDVCIKDIKHNLMSYKVDPIKCWNKPLINNIKYYIDAFYNNDDISDIKFSEYKYRCEFIDRLFKNNCSIVRNNNCETILFILNSIGYSYYFSLSGKAIHVVRFNMPYYFTIKHIGRNQYYGFEITGNGRFVLGNFIVTHNTSTILALARELFGPDKFRERIIELNASDERGINIVRDKLVAYAKLAVGNSDPKYKCPPYKIIILDEADAMTTEAQSALRKIIEDKSHVTIFCFICNYINQIIDPIASRCVKLHFKPIENNYIYNKLSLIANNESMRISDDSLQFLSEISAGDMRKGIMLLQNLKYLNKNIDLHDVCYLANIMPFSDIEKIINMCLKKISIEMIAKYAKQIILSGYPIDNIIRQINQIIIRNLILTDIQKIEICCLIADKERLLIDGANEYLQLLDLLQEINGIKN